MTVERRLNGNVKMEDEEGGVGKQKDGDQLFDGTPEAVVKNHFELDTLRPNKTGLNEELESMLYPTLVEEESTFLPQNIYNWLYPPDVPRECQLMRIENLAVPCCYLLVGILQGLSGPFINVYPIDIKATEAQQVTISSIRSLPASFKLVFGFISDNLPLGGYRRKSYMVIGWLMASLSLITLWAFSDLSMPREEQEVQQDDGTTITKLVALPPENAPSVPFLSTCLLGFGTGFWLADVMGDSIVAEKAKLEVEKGHIQSTCYACRFFGLMCAAPISTLFYSLTPTGPEIVIGIMSVVPLLILPLVFLLGEQRNTPVKPTSEQCGEIWRTVCSRAVWQPMGFVFLYNVLQVGNGAWRQFLKTVLNFTPTQLNIILVVAHVLLYLGVMAYKYYFIKWSWRAVYIMTTLLNGFFSALQILLILGETFGLPPFWFALGDDAFAEFIGGIQFLPTTIMMVHLCPAGSEGASYAMFTTVNNAALNLSSAISSRLLAIWDVGKEALENNQLSGITNLTILTTALQVSGVLFVWMLPRTKEELVQLDKSSSKNEIGGSLFLLITILSLLYAVVVGIFNIAKPGWAGES